ncbi:PAS domain S-box-containing protein/diguanylate cyclase (GGDEF) domain-containing protein [Noviherbaspirillum humi]|uniref:PAS domain S-box-containing protein/diguanylate cyclase (GGDEF) domain-containing protein n=1 Tax=Noviherbaspirillum humi TaxID=1688639 RepID=A0A239IDX1_9BURK|nr:EAL domain-containing protein [Noviherbaspirillum humi]SNS91966.1 PAS domain S-box-containing protein/diguanylate cyclase (GGDEF) domain-containing protein [Noviherbaspirillum humi]
MSAAEIPGSLRAFSSALSSEPSLLSGGTASEWFSAQQNCLDQTYRLAAGAAGIGLWYLDQPSQTIMLSPTLARLVGFPERFHLIPADRWMQLICLEDRAGVAKHVSGGRPFDIEYRLQLPAGEKIWLLTRATVVWQGKDNAGRIIGVCMDVSARKDAEAAAHASAERYRALADSNPDGILVKRGGRFVYANPSAARILNADTPRSLIRRLAEEQASGSPMSELLQRLTEACQVRREAVPATFRCARPNRDAAFLDVSCAFLNWEGRPATQFILRDVTEKTQTRDHLRVMNERLKLAVEGTGEGIWEWDLIQDTYSVSGKLKEIFGWQKNERFTGKVNWRRLIHSEDYERVMEAVQACVRGDKKIYECEFRLLDRQGRWKWVLSRGVVVAWDQAGQPIAMGGMTSDISVRKDAEGLAWRHANVDALTGLANRRMFRDRLEQEIRSSQRSDRKLALLFVDLDGFKHVNDLYGHDVGDLLLIEAAYRIKACVRKTDVVARWGGDEFTIILTGLEDLGHVDLVIEKLLHGLATPFYLGHALGHITGSIGAALFPLDTDEGKDLIKKADQAMYIAKQNGKNRFSYYRTEMDEHAHTRLRLSNALRRALAVGELSLHFQPVVDLNTSNIVKAEALLRWQHPEMGNIEPAKFIPLAEETGLILEISNWVFCEAVACAKQACLIAGHLIPISINRSPVEFLSENASSDWLDYLAKMNVPTSAIIMEITEGLLLHPSQAVKNQLLRYAESGLMVALDDFGTGYSAMSYLHQFHLDYLKIDQSFVKGISENRAHRTIVETIILMAHKLGLKVIAEGIETEEQRRLLLQAGCDYGQGYYFSHAVPAAIFQRMLGNAAH